MARAANGPAIRISAVAVLFLAVAVLPAAHLPWAIVVPTIGIAAGMLAPRILGRGGPVRRWLADRSLAGWLGLWLLLLAIVLGLIGAFFRGPGWRWVWPWNEGIY